LPSCRNRAPYGAGAPVPPRGSHGSPGKPGLACGLIFGFAAPAFLSRALRGVARFARSPSLSCHTGESRCPPVLWVPAFAGATRRGSMRSELKRAGTAVSRTVTVEPETVVVRGIRSRSARAKCGEAGVPAPSLASLSWRRQEREVGCRAETRRGLAREQDSPKRKAPRTASPSQD